MSHHNQYKLVLFGLNGILTDCFLHKALSHKHGGAVAEQNSEMYLEGKIPYSELFRRQIKFLKKSTRKEFSELARTARVEPGACEVMGFLHRQGVKTGIISCDCVELAKRVAGKVGGMSFVFANTPVFDKAGRLTGFEEPAVSDSSRKKIFEQICRFRKIKPSQCVVIGQNLKDLGMLESAGFKIGFRAHPKVRAVADANVENMYELEEVFRQLFLPAG